MFKHRNVLPDALDRQDPRVLLDMIDNLNSGNEPEAYTGNDPYLKMFYGQ